MTRFQIWRSGWVKPLYGVTRAFLVNMKYIRRVEHDRFKLENGEEIPISKKRYMEARTRYFQYLEDAVS